MERDFFTDALHADDHLAELSDVAPPLRPSTTFHYTENGRVYRRESDEVTERLEAVLGSLDEGHAVAYPSGMAAATAVLRHIRPERVSLPDDVYHGVRVFVHAEAERGTWQVVEAADLGVGDVLWVETPSNPKCLITDLTAVAADAKARGVVTVADATFATPVLQSTLSHGIDYVMHATTKFIAGHSDAMGGVLVANDPEAASVLRESRTIDGAIPGTLESWLTLRGIRTLPLRVERQSESALAIAEHLHDMGLKVWYPGLRSHPGHDVAKSQMVSFGGVLSFEVEGATRAAATVDGLSVFTSATSLGGVESLAEHRVRSDEHAPPGLIRLSIGLESADALIDDLRQALAVQ